MANLNDQQKKAIGNATRSIEKSIKLGVDPEYVRTKIQNAFEWAKREHVDKVRN